MNNKNSKTKKHLKLASVLSAITICSVLGSSAQQAHANRLTDFFRRTFNNLRTFLGMRSSSTTNTTTSTKTSGIKIKRATTGTSNGSNDSMRNQNELKVPTYKSGTSKTQGTGRATGGTGEGKEPVYAKLNLQKLGVGSSEVKGGDNGTIYTKVKGSPKTDTPDLSKLNLKKGRASAKVESKKPVWNLFQQGIGTSETPPPLPAKQNKYPTQSTVASTSSGTGTTGATGPAKPVDKAVQVPEKPKQTVFSKLKTLFDTSKKDANTNGTIGYTTGAVKSNENSDDLRPRPKTTTTKTTGTGTSSDTGTKTTTTRFEELKAFFEGKTSQRDISYTSKLDRVAGSSGATSETAPTPPPRNESLSSNSYTGPVSGNKGISPKAQKVLGAGNNGYTGDYSVTGDPTGTKSKLSKRK